MKILFVTDFFPTGKDLRFSGGVEARTFFVAKNLAHNNTVHIITTKQKGATEIEKMHGMTVHRVGPASTYSTGAISPLELPRKLLFAYAAIKRGVTLDIDVVDGADFIGHFISKIIAIRKKVPVVFWYPDVFIGQWIKTSGLIAGFGGWTLEKLNLALGGDHFIAISDVTRQKLIKRSIHSKKISVISCGVDLLEFKKTAKKSHFLEILTISRLVSYKRIPDLILAFALLGKKNKKMRLKIIGRGSDKGKLVSLCNTLKINNKVTFSENLPRRALLEELKSSSIFSLPSEVEGFGISTIEAAAAGIPYVISDIPVFREVTHNGRGGLIFKLGDIRDLEKKIETLIKNKTLYSKKSKEGQVLAKEYSWDKITIETENVYKKLINNG